MNPDEEYIQVVIKSTCINLGHPELLEKITFRFSSKPVRHFAEARCDTNELVFTRAAWDAATIRERYELVVHEVCHLIAYVIRPNECSHHGKTWQNLMRDMGFAPDRFMYIAYAPPPDERLFELRCECSVHILSAVELKSIRRAEKACPVCFVRLNKCEVERVDF